MNDKSQQLQLKAALLGIPLLCEYCRAYCIQKKWDDNEQEEALFSTCSRLPHVYNVRYGEDVPDNNEWTKYITKASSCPDFDLYPYFSDQMKDSFTD